MAIHFGKLFLSFVFLSICFQFAASANSPEISPSPAPETGSDTPPSPFPVSQSPSADAPSPSNGPASSSPPAPPESPATSSTPPSAENPPVPSPSPDDASDINHSDINADGDQTIESSDGMSGGKKAGIAVGVIAAACFVGLGALVFKKRQDNIRRSRYGYTARGDIL